MEHRTPDGLDRVLTLPRGNDRSVTGVLPLLLKREADRRASLFGAQAVPSMPLVVAWVHAHSRNCQTDGLRCLQTVRWRW